MLMCIPMVTVLDRRLIVIPVVTLGVLVQLLAVTVGSLDYLMLLRSQPFEREGLYVGGSDRIDFEDVRFNPSYSQLVGNWVLLRYAVGLAPAPGSLEDAKKVGTRLCDAIPAQAWADAARWDFIWSPRRHAAASPADSAPGR